MDPHYVADPVLDSEDMHPTVTLFLPWDFSEVSQGETHAILRQGMKLDGVLSQAWKYQGRLLGGDGT